MSKKKQARQERRTTKRKRHRPTGAPPLGIPIVVGLVVVTTIAGAILLRETQRPIAQILPGELPASASTARPLPIGSAPYPEVPRISPDEAKAQIDDGLALLVDVRSRDFYNENHATGAISVPETELEARLDDLPQDRSLVLY